MRAHYCIFGPSCRSQYVITSLKLRITCVLSLNAVISNLYSWSRASCNSSFFFTIYHKYHDKPQITTPGKPNPARTSTSDFKRTSITINLLLLTLHDYGPIENNKQLRISRFSLLGARKD